MESAGTLALTAVKCNIMVCLVVAPCIAEAIAMNGCGDRTQTFVMPLCVLTVLLQSFSNGMAPFCR
jgi:hypothetical protein